jgi:hypothetical protein
MNITHTSETEQGQIYIGQINWLIPAGVTLLVLFPFVFKSGFRSALPSIRRWLLIRCSPSYFSGKREPAALIVIPALLAIFTTTDLPRRQRTETREGRLYVVSSAHHHSAHGHLDVCAMPWPPSFAGIH